MLAHAHQSCKDIVSLKPKCLLLVDKRLSGRIEINLEDLVTLVQKMYAKIKRGARKHSQKTPSPLLNQIYPFLLSDIYLALFKNVRICTGRFQMC